MKNVSERRKEELIEELEILQPELGEIVSRMSNVCDEIGDGHAQAYLIAPLEIITEQGYWISREFTLQQWIDQLKGKELLDGK